MDRIAFASSMPNTLGIELELQLIHPVSFDLSGKADDMLTYVADHPMADRVKPEITQSMIEINSSVHEHPVGLQAEMREMRDLVCAAGASVGVGVCGGGTHPFMRWQDCAISDAKRFQYLAEMYGYLARQFTVFGQHIHVGVDSGDQAIELTRRLSPYVPHLIALSAASPYCEGVDSSFACSRLNAVNSFPLSGHMPESIRDWYGFEAHVSQLFAFGVAESLKDLYWDIRPKPDFGTVEIRVCDTPLTIERACQIAAFVQALSVAVMREDDAPEGLWVAYRNNVFQASRFGTQAHYVTPRGERLRLADHLRATFERLMPVASELGTTDMVSTLGENIAKQGNDARWMRTHFQKVRSLPLLVQSMTRAFRGSHDLAPPNLTRSTQRRRVRARSEPLPDAAGGHDLLLRPPMDSTDRRVSVGELRRAPARQAWP